MTLWKKQKPIEGHISCLTCGCGAHDLLDMDQILAVGFGDVLLTCDGELIYDEPREEKDWWDASRAEELALSNPYHDWQIQFVAPLYGSTYQRQGAQHWPLIKKDMGFA